MKSQPKLHLPQLKLPLLDQAPITMPPAKDEELVRALVELLLRAAGNANPAMTGARGGNDEPEADH
jgi:hypothetical protein